jgi:hypothetical protein
MRVAMKKLIMSALAALILLPGVANTVDAQHGHWGHRRHWRESGRIIIVQPYSPVYYPVYEYPVYDPYLRPVYNVAEPFPYLQEKGYKEGRDEGKDDAEDGKPPNPTIHKDFYKSYSPIYRQAFIQGYYDEYRRKMMY